MGDLGRVLFLWGLNFFNLGWLIVELIDSERTKPILAMSAIMFWFTLILAVVATSVLTGWKVADDVMTEVVRSALHEELEADDDDYNDEDPDPESD